MSRPTVPVYRRDDPDRSALEVPAFAFDPTLYVRLDLVEAAAPAQLEEAPWLPVELEPDFSEPEPQPDPLANRRRGRRSQGFRIQE